LLARDNLLSPTKGWGPFSRPSRPTIIKPLDSYGSIDASESKEKDLAVVALAAGAVDAPVELFFMLQISAE
jgi:hypothetical protein